MRLARFALLFSGIAMFAACGDDRDAEPDAQVTPADTQQTGMGGVMPMQSSGMMDEMAAHMQMMQSATPDSMMAMMPMHRQMGGNLLMQLEREMRDMNMQPDAQWTAVVDSVRQDLARMPAMSAAELRAVMPAHHGRVSRLMEMHRTVMRSMGH